MCTLVRAFLPLVLVCFGGRLQDAPAIKADHPPTASVSGRVTIGDNPAIGVQVALVPAVANALSGVRRATTDHDGRYLLDSLASGYYTIHVLAPTMAVQGKGDEGQQITLRDAVKVENIDFALVPGGVITGRVTDGDGSPITDQFPRLMLVDEKGQSKMFWPSPQESETDDRGTYRIYGLPPGRYIIGFGVEGGSTHEHAEIVAPSQLYPLTYYPGVLEEASAKTIEVAAGSEITGVDISLTAKKSLFKASGTVVDADTGALIAGAALYHAGGGSPFADQRTVRSDSDGQFKFDRLQTGKHSLTLANDYSEAANLFTDQVTFEVIDGDVDGLEVKVHHGLSISGVVVSANPSDQAIASALASRAIYASQLRTNPDKGTPGGNGEAQAKIAADGSFRLAGLAPGKYRLQLSYEGADSFHISYIDVPGVGRLTNKAPYPPGSFEGDPIEIGEGQNSQDIRGVRITIGRANGVIRGQLKFEGGSLPPNTLMDVSIVMLPPSDTRPYAGARVDPDGRFLIRSLTAGQYLIRAAAYINPPNQSGGKMKVLARASETVSISDGQEINLTLVLNLGPGQQETQK